MFCHWSASTGDVLSLVYPEGFTRTHSPAKVSNIQSKIWERKKKTTLTYTGTFGIKIIIINHMHYLGCMAIDVKYVGGSNRLKSSDTVCCEKALHLHCLRLSSWKWVPAYAGNYLVMEGGGVEPTLCAFIVQRRMWHLTLYLSIIKYMIKS